MQKLNRFAEGEKYDYKNKKNILYVSVMCASRQFDSIGKQQNGFHVK